MSKVKEGKEVTPWTMTIVEAGRRYYGVGKNRAYEMARSGLMPTIEIGERGKRALPRAIEKQLEGGGVSQP